MKSIELSVTIPTASAEDVLDALRHEGRAGVVYFARPDDPRIIQCRDLVRATRRGIEELSRVRSLQAWLAAQPGPEGLELGSGFDVARRLRKFRRAPQIVGVLDARRDSAIVIAKNDDILRLFAGRPYECYCRGPRMHGYWKPAPDVCGHDHTKIDC